MTSDVIKTLEGLESLRDEWEDLYERANRPSPFLRPTWLLSWTEAYARDRALACITIREGDRLVAFAPLFLSMESGFRILRLLGDGRLDYLGFLVAADDVSSWSALGCALSDLDTWDALDLRSWCLPPLPEDFLAKLRRSSVAQRVFERCPVVDTSQAFEEFLKAKRSKFRKWMRQIDRQTAAHGQSQIRFIDSMSLSPTHIDDLVALETRARHWSEGTGHFQDSRFSMLLKAALQRGSSGLQLLLLEISGRIVSAELLAESDSSIYGIWTTYDSQFNGTGSFIVNEAVKRAFERGYRRFDFMQGDQTYKTWWATSVIDVQEIAIGRGPRGLAWLAMMQVRWKLSQQLWAQQLRARLKQLARVR